MAAGRCAPCYLGNHTGTNGTPGCRRGHCRCSCRERQEPVDVEIVDDAFLGPVVVRMYDGVVLADGFPGLGEAIEHVQEHRPDLRIYVDAP